jgi:hypothetical protein
MSASMPQSPLGAAKTWREYTSGKQKGQPTAKAELPDIGARAAIVNSMQMFLLRNLK